MDQIWLHLLLLSGLSLTLCIQQEYILIKQAMTWGNAQNYCRTNHIDLATVQSNDNWTTLLEAVEGFPGYAWIGLYNDINSWRWSYNEESLVFKSWAVGQPDYYGWGQVCAAIVPDGTWQDFSCDESRYFVCYNGSANTTEKMVLIQISKTWADARAYCKDHYTDLAIIRSKGDSDEITKLTYSLGILAWIGLYRDTWKWSDQANIASSTQQAINTFSLRYQNCVAAYIYSRTLDDWACASAYYFCCNTVKRKRQLMRVQVKAPENVDEAKLKTLVSNQLKQTLRDDDVTMKWRTQPNGKVFQKKRTVQKHSEENTTQNANGTATLVLSRTPRTRLVPQRFCRDHYTDQATVKTQDDSDQIAKRIYGLGVSVWIGLYRDTWKWSDRANFTSLTQDVVQKLVGANENCATIDYWRAIEDRFCTEAHYFYCNTVRRNRQVIRVQVKAAENANEERLKVLVLNKLKQTLSDEDVSMTWKIQPNAKVFQKNRTV